MDHCFFYGPSEIFNVNAKDFTWHEHRHRAIFLFPLSAISFLICIILILYFYFCVSIQSSEFLYLLSYLKKLTKIYYSTTARTFVCLCFFLYISILNLSFSESGFIPLPIPCLFLFRQHKKPKAARNLTKDIFKIVYFHFSVIVWQFRIYRISTNQYRPIPQQHEYLAFM